MVQSKLRCGRHPIKTVTRVFAGIVLGAVLLIAAVLGYAVYANLQAEQAAAKLCARLQVGQEVDRAIAAARDAGARHRGPLPDGSAVIHDFEFQGWVFNVGVCRAVVASGKISTLEVKLEGD